VILRVLCSLVGHRWCDVSNDAARQAGLIFLRCKRCEKREALVRELRW
jgi:hypothetical protein